MSRVIFYVISTILVVGCSFDDICDVHQIYTGCIPETINVSLEDETTRVQLNADGKTVWTQGDEVTAFYKSDANNRFRFMGKTGDRNGGFRVIEQGTETIDINEVILLYPYSDSYKLNPHKKTVDIKIPSIQYHASGSYGIGANLMASVEMGDNFTLKSLCGWIVVQLNGTGTVTSVKLTGNNGEQLAGDAKFNYEDFDIELLYYPIDPDDNSQVGGSLIFGDYQTSITLDCNDGIVLHDTKPTEFYFVVPPQIYTKGITIEATCSDGTVLTKSSSKELVIERNHIVPMATLTVAGEIINNTIIYTSTEKINPYSLNVFNANVIDNEWSQESRTGVITFDDTITSIGEKAFYGSSALTSIIIPNSVTEIGDSAFEDCFCLLDVFCKPKTPPTLGLAVFENNDPNRKIYVQNESLSIYKNSDTWNEYEQDIYVQDNVLPNPDGYNQIVYTASEKITPQNQSWDGFEANIISNIWSPNTGEGVIIFDNNITVIGANAFNGCDNLTSVTIPNSIISIKSNAFQGCDNLYSIVIPNSVCTIESGAFRDCCNLTTITIPDSVEEIGDSVFSGCNCLRSVTLGNRIRSINNGTFENCDSLRSITIGSKIDYIDGGAFYGCDNLKNIYISDLSAWCKIDFDSSDWYWSGHILENGAKLYVNNVELIDLIIPEDIDTINSWSFARCSSLKSVTIHNGVTMIGANAFRECANLSNVTIGNKLAKIGNNAFYNCSNLASITIPNSIIEIQSSAFNGCSSLTCVEIPDSVTTLGESAFAWCSELVRVVIGNGVSSIDSNTFHGCEKLRHLTIGNQVSSIGYSAFYNCNNLVDVVIPNSTSTIGESVFYSCDNLESVKLGDNVSLIDNYAFQECYNLMNVIIPNSVTKIGDCAFFGCNSLASITLPESVVYLGYKVFGGCKNLKEFKGKYASADGGCLIKDGELLLFAPGFVESEYLIPNSVVKIGENAFNNCDNITSVTIPNSIEIVGDNAFSECDNLTSVHIYDGVKTIGDYAFCDCYNLSDVNIGNSVKFIGVAAFQNCNNLTNIILSNSLEVIDEHAFDSCDSLISITIPKNVVSVGGGAFYYCSSLQSIYCKPTTPPHITSYIYDGNILGGWYNSENLKIYVPVSDDDSIINNYKSALRWSEYADKFEEYNFEN